MEEWRGGLRAGTGTAGKRRWRVQGECDNYRKRNAALAEEMKTLGKSMVIEKLLGVLDNCALARKYITDEACLTGFDMMERQLLDALSAFGLEEIAAENADFDPAFMAAVERESGDESTAGNVVEVPTRGSKLHGKVMRPARVKVGS